MKKILLVDGSNLAFRMYFALERTALTAPDGRPSWAIFGFFKYLIETILKEKPAAVIIAFDTSQPTFRHEAFSYYKANRPDEMPEALAIQWPEISRGLEELGVPLLRLPGFEADDLIGSLSVAASEANLQTLILSGDKDMLQLVNEQVQVLYPTNQGLLKIDREGVFTKLGVHPEQVVDYKALCGDSSDNIPGVKGIGEKTATKLLAEYGTLESVYQNLEKISSASLRQKLSLGREDASDSRFLAEIKTDSPITYDFYSLPDHFQPHLEGFRPFLREYNLNTLQKKLSDAYPELASLPLFEGKTQTAQPDQTSQPEPPLPVSNLDIRYQTITQVSDLELYLAEAIKSKSIALDLETDGLDTSRCQIVGFALAYLGDQEQYFSVYIPTGHDQELLSGAQLSVATVTQKLIHFFNEFKGDIFLQNLKFEEKILTRHGLNLPKRSLDTMLASYVQNPEQYHGLKRQALRVFNYRMREIDSLIGSRGKNQKTMNQVSVELVSPYACDDAALTLALGEYYLKILEPSQIPLWQKIESPFAFVIASLESNGVPFSADALSKMVLDLKEKLLTIEGEIQGKLPRPINLNSGAQMAAALTELGFSLTKETAKGSVSTDAKILNALVAIDSSGLIAQILEYRSLTKILSTYAEPLLAYVHPATGRIHAEFNQAITTTGRLSSSNPNLQNIPIKNENFGPALRRALAAPEGSLIISADYSQIELRLLAHLSGDLELIQAFQQGEDIHAKTAASIFHIPVPAVTGEQRRIGKTLNFALIYQQGVLATAEQLAVSNEEASGFMKRYFESFPAVKPYLQSVLESARAQGYAETLWGRRRYFKNLASKMMQLRKADERAAINFPLQGTAADIIKIGMIDLSQALEEGGLKSRLILQVHDEILLEVPEAELEQVQALVISKMTLDQPLSVPLVIDIGFGANWQISAA